MRIANISGRATIVIGDEIVDVETASGGAFGSDPMGPYRDWSAFRSFADGVTVGSGPLVESDIGCAVPRPAQVFAIGINYRAHAAETGKQVPEVPATFTKFPTSLSGPFSDVDVSNGTTDWEVELVAVVGTRADRVAESDGWSHIAGVTVGQDITDRALQVAAGRQFSLGKSRTGYGPIGPTVVTPDELSNPDDLALGCSIAGETLQNGRTDDLVFNVPRLVAELSAVLPLLPGDLIFTGTPAGVGVARDPQRFLQPGELLETWIDGVGFMRNRCV